MSTFVGKTILITGGARGLGLLMARCALEQSAGRIVLWDLNAAGLAAAARELTANLESVQADSGAPARVVTMVVDVTDPAAIDAAAREVGTVDVLFNNAGVVTGRPFAEQDADRIERTIRVNVLGCMHVARVFLPGMIASGSGHIVNLASAAGLLPNPDMSVYCGSKWAVVGWSESLRIELERDAPGVRVTTVHPTYINTGMFDGVRVPAGGKLLDPEDVVRKIFRAVERDQSLLYLPNSVRVVPILRGLLPARWFDRIVGRWGGVYKSMRTFQGHGG